MLVLVCGAGLVWHLASGTALLKETVPVGEDRHGGAQASRINERGFTLTVDGRTYSATLTVPDHNSVTGLQAGCDYRFPVTVSKTGLTVGTAGINDWTTVADDENTATM